MIRALIAVTAIWIGLAGMNQAAAGTIMPEAQEIAATRGLSADGGKAPAGPVALSSMTAEEPVIADAVRVAEEDGEEAAKTQYSSHWRASGNSDPLALLYLSAVLLGGAGMCVWQAARAERRRLSAVEV